MSENPKLQINPEGSADIDLVRRSQAGDTDAYEELIRRYHGKIYGLIYNMTSSREAAEGLVQEVFVKAWKALGHFHEQAGVYIWIYRIALNRTISFCKKRNRSQPVGFDEFDPDIKTAEAYREFSSKGSVLRKMSLGEFQTKINGALLKLPEKQRAVVVMNDVQGIPHADIAKVVRCLERTVRARLSHAHKQLQAELAEFVKSEKEKTEAPELDIAGLLALKTYERPDALRVEKNIQNTMRAIRTTSNVPSLLLFPDKSFAWMFAQPRYGVAALFILFLGLHLLDRPLSRVSAGAGAIKDPSEEVVILVDTNRPKAVAVPGITPPFSVIGEPALPSSFAK